MFLKRGLGPFAIAAWALGAGADPSASDDPHDAEVERYTRLADDIRDFDRFSNAEMNDLIFAGLYNDNPEVVALTVAAVDVEARYRYFRGGGYTAGFRRMIGKHERELVRVPGFRDFLMHYGREGLAQHAWKPVDEMTVEYMDANPWERAFGTLTIYFPGDPEVRLLLRDSYQGRADAADRQHELMNLLNGGLFVDAEADALRVDQLANPNPTWAGNAAWGLAMSGTEAGLNAMADAILRREDGLEEIATAMGMYGAPAAPHLTELLHIRTKADSPLSLDDAVTRLAGQMGRLVDARRGVLPGAPALDGVRTGAAAGQPAVREAEALELDDQGVPLLTNWQGRKEPLDFALQLHDAFTDRQVLDTVFAGLTSSDPEVVEQTIFTVGFYANVIAQRDWPSYALVRGEHLRKIMDTRTRRLEEVPGLKGILLAHARGGMSPASCRERARRRAPEWPSWMLSVAALAVYFPGNAEVRDLVLDMGRCLDAAEVGQSILPLLAVGRFRGEAVENWRIAKLTHADPIKAGWAARGLCWTLTDTGLAALAAHLPGADGTLVADEALAEIVDAIACHGARAAPHLPALRALAERPLPEAALARIASATDKVATLANRRSAEADGANATVTE